MTEIQKQALLEGTQVAVYEIKEFLGSNQSEIIYRAWNAHLNGMVILKEFFPFKYAVREEGTQAVKTNLHENTSVLEFGLGNFIQQNEKLLEAQFPGAQAVHNVIEFNQTAYLAVEEQKGSSLSESLKKGETYTEDELRALLDSLLGTLENFHEAGIVHGDIHPGNILIQKSGKPVLLNFASARQKFSRLINDPASELHSGYGAPEQYLDEGSSEPPSDLYALGAVLYRCITGADPEDARNRLSDLGEGKADPLKSILDKTDSGFSGEFLVTVDWMLQVDSKVRPQSTSEVSAALNKDKSNFKYIAASTPSKTESSPKQPVLTAASKGKRFGVATLAASVLASATLSSAVTWYLKQNETPPESVLSEPQRSEEGIAFGKAIERNQVMTAEEKIATPEVVAAAEKTLSSEDASGITAAIENQADPEPALNERLITEETNQSENLASSQQKSAKESVVDGGQEEKELDDTQEKNTEFQAEAPIETHDATQLPEASLDELDATGQAEAEMDSTSPPEETVADSKNEKPVSTESDDGSSSADVVESKEIIATAPETTPSIENTNTPLPESSADIPEIASQVETNNDTSSQELGSSAEAQLDSEQPEKETDGTIENQEVVTSQVAESDEDGGAAQSISPTVANTNAQSAEDLAKAPGADIASTADSEKETAPLPEMLTNQSANNPSPQASLADKPVDQVGVESQAEGVADGQAESINRTEIQNDSPDSETATAKEELPTSQESEQTVASAKEPLSDDSAKAPGTAAVEADPAAASLLDSPREATSLLSEDPNISDPSGTNQVTSDKPEKGIDIFIENPEKTLEKIQRERDLVQQYMAKAKENFTLLKLTTPPEDNAYYYYKLVLEIDPQHEGAQKGSEDIFNKYVLLINNAIKNKKMDIAKAYLDRAKTILPDSSSHQSVIEDLNNSLVQQSG